MTHKYESDSKSPSETPLADALLAAARNDVVSFHALPIGFGAGIEDCHLKTKYHALLGPTLLNHDVTLSSPQLDSFFFPDNAIKEAQSLAANLYGADETLFVTAGTTVANQIAVAAVCQNGTRVLMDKRCHQSLHFAVHAAGSEVTYLEPTYACEQSGRSHWCLDDLVARVITAETNGAPFDTIILTAHSYEGVIYDIPRVLEYLITHGASTRKYIVDEAWGSINYMHPELKAFAATNVSLLRAQYPDLVVVVTQSAHKSLNCLRQGSMIHLCGTSEMAEKLKRARFKLHTTSPSYPILASLDLACAHMRESGERLALKATALASEFCESFVKDQGLSAFTINHYSHPTKPWVYAKHDPTKVSVDISRVGLLGRVVRDVLYKEYGVYVNRVTETSLLFNFHIGVRETAVGRALQALRAVQTRYREAIDAYSGRFVIAYPPGVPILVPGEPCLEQAAKMIGDSLRAGTPVFTI